MGVNSLPKTVTRQRRDCDLNPGPSASESSTLTIRLPSHPMLKYKYIFEIKYTEAILSNNTQELLRFEITKLLIAV